MHNLNVGSHLGFGYLDTSPSGGDQQLLTAWEVSSFWRLIDKRCWELRIGLWWFDQQLTLHFTSENVLAINSDFLGFYALPCFNVVVNDPTSHFLLSQSWYANIKANPKLRS